MKMSNIGTLPHVVPYWNKYVKDSSCKIIWLLTNQCLITNKIKEISFEIIHRFIPATIYIKSKFLKKH